MNFKIVVTGATLGLGLGLAASAANAAVTYIYTGSPFADTSPGWAGANRLTGTMVLSEALAPNLSPTIVKPISFSFTGGVDADMITETATKYAIFKFQTDTSGKIVAWDNIYYIGLYHSFESGTSGDDILFSRHRAISNTSGSWSLVAGPVPEPATWAMMITGFFGTGAMIRRRRPGSKPQMA